MVTLIEKSQTNTINQLPDGPKAPRLIQTLQGILRPLEYLEQCTQRYGGIFTMRFAGFGTSIVISDPKGMEEVFTADPQLFESGSGNQILQPMFGSNSMILLDGERHQRQRKLLMPPFHGERMKAYGQLINDVTEQVISQWEIGKPFSARSSTQEISLRVILRAVFGMDEGERFDQLRQLLSEWTDIFNSPWRSSFAFLKFLQTDLGPLTPWGRFLRLRQQIDQLLYTEIRERRAENDPSRVDILSLMMAARDEEGQPMSEEELRDELMTLLFAGHETTASALAWALYWIHQLPQVKEQLMQELSTITLETDPTTIAKLPYLNAVCSETLRIYPVALFAFSRIPKVPMEVMGYRFEPGIRFSPCIYLLHHREDLYPESKQFKPERFLERQFSPYEFIPFGGSNRRCLGYAFALFEMKLVLAKILLQTQLKLVDQRPVKSVRRGITMAPSGGVQLIATGFC